MMGGGGGFAPLVGLRKDDRDFVFAAEDFEYGLELDDFTFGFFFVLPIARVVIGNLRTRGALELRIRCQAAKPCGEQARPSTSAALGALVVFAITKLCLLDEWHCRRA